jgi:hypothetical protein
VKKKTLLPLPGLEQQFMGHPASSYTDRAFPAPYYEPGLFQFPSCSIYFSYSAHTQDPSKYGCTVLLFECKPHYVNVMLTEANQTEFTLGDSNTQL